MNIACEERLNFMENENKMVFYINNQNDPMKSIAKQMRKELLENLVLTSKSEYKRDRWKLNKQANEFV